MDWALTGAGRLGRAHRVCSLPWPSQRTTRRTTRVRPASPVPTRWPSTDLLPQPPRRTETGSRSPGPTGTRRCAGYVRCRSLAGMPLRRALTGRVGMDRPRWTPSSCATSAMPRSTTTRRRTARTREGEGVGQGRGPLPSWPRVQIHSQSLACGGSFAFTCMRPALRR
jgi:hypothetical protein